MVRSSSPRISPNRRIVCDMRDTSLYGACLQGGVFGSVVQALLFACPRTSCSSTNILFGSGSCIAPRRAACGNENGVFDPGGPTFSATVYHGVVASDGVLGWLCLVAAHFSLLTCFVRVVLYGSCKFILNKDHSSRLVVQHAGAIVQSVMTGSYSYQSVLSAVGGMIPTGNDMEPRPRG